MRAASSGPTAGPAPVDECAVAAVAGHGQGCFLGRGRKIKHTAEQEPAIQAIAATPHAFDQGLFERSVSDRLFRRPDEVSATMHSNLAKIAASKPNPRAWEIEIRDLEIALDRECRFNLVSLPAVFPFVSPGKQYCAIGKNLQLVSRRAELCGVARGKRLELPLLGVTAAETREPVSGIRRVRQRSAANLIDRTDRRILEILQQEARKSHRALAKAIGLTVSSAWKRVKRLERDGFILGYRAVIAPSMLGADIDVVARLELRSTLPAGFRHFESALKSSPGVLGAKRMGSPGAYLLRLASRDSVAWIEGVIEKLGLRVITFETQLVMEEIKPYRDPPIRALINWRADQASEEP
jgi:Lrp/AsnC family leucine-responsive transcriptional regulator